MRQREAPAEKTEADFQVPAQTSPLELGFLVSSVASLRFSLPWALQKLLFNVSYGSLHGSMGGSAAWSTGSACFCPGQPVRALDHWSRDPRLTVALAWQLLVLRLAQQSFVLWIIEVLLCIWISFCLLLSFQELLSQLSPSPLLVTVSSSAPSLILFLTSLSVYQPFPSFFSLYPAGLFYHRFPV